MGGLGFQGLRVWGFKSMASGFLRLGSGLGALGFGVNLGFRALGFWSLKVLEFWVNRDTESQNPKRRGHGFWILGPEVGSGSLGARVWGSKVGGLGSDVGFWV